MGDSFSEDDEPVYRYDPVGTIPYCMLLCWAPCSTVLNLFDCSFLWCDPRFVKGDSSLFLATGSVEERNLTIAAPFHVCMARFISLVVALAVPLGLFYIGFTDFLQSVALICIAPMMLVLLCGGSMPGERCCGLRPYAKVIMS